MTIAFRALGPVAVEFDGVSIPLRPREQTLLAVLLARTPRHWASSDELTDALWPGQPPEKALNSLRVLAHRIRANFRAVGRHRLVTESTGYRLVVEHDELDLQRFADAERRAREVGQDDPETACRILRTALQLWRGEPFSDVEAGLVRESAERYRVVREGVVSTLAEIELRRGNHRGLRADIDGWAAEFPWSENLARSQVLAHHRCGDVKAATDRHRDFTRRLRTELGVDPSASFRDLLTRLLDGREPRSAAPLLSVTAGRPASPPPRGRADIADRISRWLTGPAPATIAMVGPAGMGKTTMLDHLANTTAGWATVAEQSTGAWYEDVFTRFGAGSTALLGSSGPTVYPVVAELVHRVLRKNGIRALGIDDAQLMSDDALVVLAQLMRLPRRPALVVATRSRALVEAAAGRGLRFDQVFDLLPLDRESAASAVRDLVPPEVLDATALTAIVDSAGGHPLLLASLARNRLMGTSEVDLPGSFAAHVADILSGSTPRQQRLLRLAALDGGDGLDIPLLARLTGVEDAVFDDVEALVASGILAESATAVSFRHAAFRECVIASVSGVRRRQVHAEFAEVLPDPDVTDFVAVQRLSHHLRGAARPEWAARLSRVLVAESGGLIERGRLLEGAACLDLAAASPSRDADPATVLSWKLGAGHARAWAGMQTDYQKLAWDLAPQARLLGPEMLGTVAVASAGLWTPAGPELPRAQDLLWEAWLMADLLSPSTRAAVIEAAVRADCDWAACPQVHAQLQALRVIDDPRTQTTAVKALHHLAWADPGAAALRVELSRELVGSTRGARGEPHLEALRMHTFDLFGSGEPQLLAATVRAYRDTADALGSTLHRWWSAVICSGLAEYAGAAEAAGRYWSRAEDLAPGVDHDLVVAARLERRLASRVRNDIATDADDNGGTGWDPPTQLHAMLQLIDSVNAALAGSATDAREIADYWRQSAVGRRERGASVLATIALRGGADVGSIAREVAEVLAREPDGLATVSGVGIFGVTAQFLAELCRADGDDETARHYDARAEPARLRFRTALASLADDDVPQPPPTERKAHASQDV